MATKRAQVRFLLGFGVILVGAGAAVFVSAGSHLWEPGGGPRGLSAGVVAPLSLVLGVIIFVAGILRLRGKA